MDLQSKSNISSLFAHFMITTKFHSKSFWCEILIFKNVAVMKDLSYGFLPLCVYHTVCLYTYLTFTVCVYLCITLKKGLSIKR